MKRVWKKMSCPRIIMLGFAGVILLGALLLMLPIASLDGQWTPFHEALFTATSAVCVTGLVIRDTATYWSGFGQGIILLLIQIGGMGVVTISIMFAWIFGRTIGLRQRSIMQEAISAHQLGGIIRLTGFIVKTTLIVELVGAGILAIRFCPEFGVGKGLWYGLFHSISAMCNAGFDLMGIKSPYSSLTDYAAVPLVNLVIMGLIVFGGIGFLVWDDIRNYHLRWKKYHMQSKVILVTTACLLVFPALYFYFFEFEHMPGMQRFWASAFQAATPRTAGFNTVDLTQLSDVGRGLITMLMLVGGAPGSTAGGIKVTTLAVLLSTAVSVLRRKESTNFFDRRVAESTVRNAIVILDMYLILFLIGGAVISRVEGLPLGTCLFETASALGTVGLSLGITGSLSVFSRCILIGLMYTGRVGGLTLLFSTINEKRESMARLPQEKLMVG